MASLDDERVFSLVASKFKIVSLNTHQKRAICEVANKGKDVFVNLPTGYGKSLIYQALPTVFDALRSSSGHIVVVGSPLISLMDDQVKFLTSVGIKALNLTSASEEQKTNAEKGKYSLVYGSPEAWLKNERWRSMLHNDVYSRKLCAIAVDEAHVLRQWYTSPEEEGAQKGSKRQEFRNQLTRVFNLRPYTITMKTAFVFLGLLLMIVASVANGSGCCDEAIETFETEMEILVQEFKSSCQSPPVASSCQELHEKDPSLPSGVYELVFGLQKLPVYCHIGNFGCGDGGWTPAMKINGSKLTFGYDSGFWSNETVFNSEGGMTGFDQKETMLPSYWMTNFSKICLGMMVNHQKNFVVIDQKASSLHSLIADGNYRATSLGRDTWKSLIGSSASLQRNCNKEGFNPVPSTWRRTRIGYVANQENNCDTCDSYVGFGSRGDMSCGNYAAHNADNGNRRTTTMGYILVQ